MPDQPEMDHRDKDRDEKNFYVLTPVALGITGASAIRGALGVMGRRRWLIGGVTIAFLAAGVAHALLTRPVYQAEAVLAPVNPDSASSGLGAVVSQFGSLASLAGLPGMTGSSTQEAVAVLKSRSFTAQFIAQRNLLPVLFSDDWDKRSGKWTTSDEDAPTLADGVELFDDQIRSVSIDFDTGLVSLFVEWSDPSLAAEWANELTTQLNRTMREREMRDASRSLEYLRQELSKSDVVEMRDALYKLIEEQEKRRMLASVYEQFAFRVLDPAVAPQADEPVRPRRLVIVLMAGLLGLLFGLGGAALAELSASGAGSRVDAT